LDGLEIQAHRREIDSDIIKWQNKVKDGRRVKEYDSWVLGTNRKIIPNFID